MAKRTQKLHSLIITHHGALKMLASAKKGNYKRILVNTPSMLKAIRILCQQILKGRIRLGRDHVKKLRPHKKLIRKIAHSPHKHIKESVQSGGNIIQSILTTVLPIITALL